MCVKLHWAYAHSTLPEKEGGKDERIHFPQDGEKKGNNVHLLPWQEATAPFGIRRISASRAKGDIPPRYGGKETTQIRRMRRHGEPLLLLQKGPSSFPGKGRNFTRPFAPIWESALRQAGRFLRKGRHKLRREFGGAKKRNVGGVRGRRNGGRSRSAPGRKTSMTQISLRRRLWRKREEKWSETSSSNVHRRRPGDNEGIGGSSKSDSRKR